MICRARITAALAVFSAGGGHDTGNLTGNQGVAPPRIGAGAAQPADSPLAPVEVSLNVQGGECRATIGGAAVDGDALLARAVSILEASIRAQEQSYGEVRAIPSVQLLGGPDVPWRCTGGMLYQLLRAGFARITFPPVVGGEPVVLDLPVADGPNAPIERALNRITIMADGRLQWNGAAVSAERLSEQLQATTSVRPMPELAIEPEAEARLDAVVALLARVRGSGIELAVGDQAVGLTLVGFAGIERYAGELK